MVLLEESESSFKPLTTRIDKQAMPKAKMTSNNSSTDRIAKVKNTDFINKNKLSPPHNNSKRLLSHKENKANLSKSINIPGVDRTSLFNVNTIIAN